MRYNILYYPPPAYLQGGEREKFNTANLAIPDFSTIEKEPQPKTCTKLSNK
jgi:hypothetical protein